MYAEFSRVRCEKSGRILFASAEVKLPAASVDLPDQLQIFSINSTQQASVARVLTSKAVQQVGDAVQYFEPSPDGRFISIPDKTGKVFVVDVGKETVTLVQPNPVVTGENKPDLFTVPQWRSNDQLTFIAPGNDNQPSVQLWSVSGNSSKTLSAKWPADLVGKNPTTPALNQPPGGL
jgi:hypothetical protein